MSEAKLFGSWGEAVAASYLREKKYKIISMGYRSRFGEIDIIAENRNVIAFVEVKTRRSSSFAMAREYVNSEKRRRIIATASLWLEFSGSKKQPRFDVIEVYAWNGVQTANPQIHHIENAFDLSSCD